MKNDQQIHYWAHMLDEAFDKEQLLTEGKHWPEDYVKTAYNTIKNSQLGKQSWYTDEYLIRDLIGPPINPNASTQQPLHDINHIDKSDLAHNANQYGILGDFSPLMHKNSNLGFFATVIRWFIEYSGTSADKYQEFIERKLDGIIGTLQTILNDQSYNKVKDEIKQKWTFSQFEQLQKKIADEAKASSDEKMKSIVRRDDYDLIPIYSYEELHEKFGGDWTGWHGESEWCHTNGESTYESWTKDGTQMFFVLAKKDWQEILQPEKKPNKTDNAYDEYGLSLIAILVDVVTGNLLNETLRWNHVIEPGYTNPGASVDEAFKNNWGELSQAVGMDVKAVCQKELKSLKQKLQKEVAEVNKLLRGKSKIDSETIPDKFRNKLFKVIIPDSVTSIGAWAFSNCTNLTSIVIHDSVTSIGYNAFYCCSNLMSVMIPDAVTSIGNYAFMGCTNLTSVTIGNGEISIGHGAFKGCTGLASVMIGDSVTSIGDNAFQGCSGLTSVTIPDSVTHIGPQAFSNCKGLTSVTIGNSVTSIGVYAFYDCISLTNVTFKGKSFEQVKAMENYSFGIEDESIIKCDDTLAENTATSFQKYEDKNSMTEATDILECISIDITDEMLQNAKIAAYMSNQVIENPYGKMKPYNPKSFPDKAVVVQFENDGTDFQIYFDTNENAWNSFFIKDGHVAKLAPEQLDSFFTTQFYAKLVDSLSKKWPTKDPTYAELWQGIMDCNCSTTIKDDEYDSQMLDEVDQPGKRKDLANQDVDHDNKRDYAGSGRKIVHFSDLGVSSKSGRYFCWPRQGKEFKWNSWKDWKKLKPFAKMYFKHNGREYMISLSLFDENFDHRGFRGADIEWTPPFAWVTPTECAEIMKLSIVRKFLRQCLKREKAYMALTPEEVYERIDKPERVTVKEIEKTMRVIRHVIKVVFKEQQADDYRYD